MALNNLKNLASLAAAAQNPVSGRQVLKLPLNSVRPKPSQVRKSFTGIKELADSLIEEGQIQPIIVSPKGDDGTYEIQKGERRWRACEEAGLPTVDAIINEEGQTELDATAGELIENIQRDDLTAMEIAEALLVFSDAGWKQKDIAKRIGKTVPFVSTHLSLLKLPEPVLSLYQQKVTQDPETLNNLRQLHALNPDRCNQLCESAGVLGISRAHSREALNELKQRGKKLPSAQSSGVGAKSAKANKTKSIPAKGTLVSNSWRPAKPSQLRLIVKVEVDSVMVNGHLRMDRIDEDANHVWVELTDGELIRVSTDLIRLDRVVGR